MIRTGGTQVDESLAISFQAVGVASGLSDCLHGLVRKDYCIGVGRRRLNFEE